MLFEQPWKYATFLISSNFVFLFVFWLFWGHKELNTTEGLSLSLVLGIWVPQSGTEPRPPEPGSMKSWPLGNQGIPNLFIFLMFNFPFPNFTLMLKVLKTVESSSSALDPAFLLSPVEILDRRQCDIVLKSYCWKAWPLNQRELRSIPNYVTTNVPLDSHLLL